MIKQIKQYWHDPVWSKVIAGAILTLAAVISTYIIDWWALIGRVLKAIVDFVFSSTAVPNWLLGLLVISLLLVIFFIGILIWSQWNPNQRAQNWRSYTSGSFFGMKWTWRYDEKGKLVDLFSFCSNCDFQIYPQRNQNIFREFTHINFHCDSCGHNFGNFQENIAQFENKVIRHIQLRIRNGTWRD